MTFPLGLGFFGRSLLHCPIWQLLCILDGDCTARGQVVDGSGNGLGTGNGL